MRKYGRSGWFNDSYRHYLASKGISSSRYYRFKTKSNTIQQRRAVERMQKWFEENPRERVKLQKTIRNIKVVPQEDFYNWGTSADFNSRNKEVRISEYVGIDRKKDRKKLCG